MRSKPSEAPPTIRRFSAHEVTYWLTVLPMVGVPLAFNTVVYNMYSSPKFAVLLITVSGLLAALAGSFVKDPGWRAATWRALCSKHVLFVALYVLVIAVSTAFGVAPKAMLFGSTYNRMGLITYVCFFVVFVSIVAHTSTNERRFRRTLWVIAITGLAVSTYAFLQFFGRDPFVQSRFYTFDSTTGPLLRVVSTLGHSNYLGNFLLYVTPLAGGLAVTSQGQERRFGVMAASLSAAAIIFSGTRGAWLGLLGGAFVFLAMMGVSGGKISKNARSRALRMGGITALAVVIASLVLIMSPASRTILQRARSFVQDTTGSGRTILWRDSLRMIREFSVVGCGPEGFRKAFLAYKSIDLSRLAPNVNNESPHNSFLDSSISFGLPGLILYVAIIVSSFSLLWKASRDSTARITAISLISSMAAVVVHNFFIFDQMPTGLYFFAFVALAYSISQNVRRKNFDEFEIQPTQESTESGSESISRSDNRVNKQATRLIALSSGYLWLIPLFVTSILFFGATWHAVGMLRADNEITKAITAASSGDLDGLLSHGNRAVNHPDATGDYHFLFARALTLYADTSILSGADGRTDPPASLGLEPSRAANLAITHAEASLPDTLTPDSSYLLLAYLAGHLHQIDAMMTYASNAVRYDPNSTNTHWVLAEAFLAKGDNESAKREASRALELDPRSVDAREVLKRSRSSDDIAEIIRKSISFAESLGDAGRSQKARRKLLRALRLSGNKCPECHRSLAALYEASHQYNDALSELKIYAAQASPGSLVEGTNARIERLKKLASGSKTQ